MRTHTYFYSASTHVQLAYIMSTQQQSHTCRTCCILTKHTSSPYTDIQRRVMEEHSVTHQNTTQCNSILPVISKKSPLPNASAQGFQENSLFPGKTLSHTNDSLFPSSPFLCLSPLTLHLIPHSSPSLCFSQSTLCLVLSSFTLSFSSSLPPIHLPPLCVW